MDLSALAAPFPPEAIHWRAQTLTQDGSKALALAYLDARDVMDHLDRVVGVENWQDSYEETAKGRVLCTIRIRINDEWIGKSDGAGDTAVEGDKGGISDAFKRAAVKWGIGRYLYDLGNVWAPCEVRNSSGKNHWKAWKPEAQRIFFEALKRIGGLPANDDTPPAETISEEQRNALTFLMESNRFPVAEFNKVSKITDLRQLPAAKFDGAMKWVEQQIKERKAA